MRRLSLPVLLALAIGLTSCTTTPPSRRSQATFPLIDGNTQAVIVGNCVIPRLKELGCSRAPAPRSTGAQEIALAGQLPHPWLQ